MRRYTTEVVFIRSLISGSVTCATIAHRFGRARRAAAARSAKCAKVAAAADASPVSAAAEEHDVPLLHRFFGDPAIWHLCMVRGLAGSLAFSFAYTSLTYMSVGDSVAIFFLNPIVSAFLAWPVLGEAVGLAEAGTDGECSPRHQTHYEPSSLELNGIL